MLMPENVFLAVKPVDMRRGIDTLTQYVQDELNTSWHEGAAFVFTNSGMCQHRNRSPVKQMTGNRLIY